MNIIKYIIALLVDRALSLPIFIERTSLWRVFSSKTEAAITIQDLHDQFGIRSLVTYCQNESSFTLLISVNGKIKTTKYVKSKLPLILYHLSSINRIWCSMKAFPLRSLRRHDAVVDINSLDESFPEILNLRDDNRQPETRSDLKCLRFLPKIDRLAILCPGPSLADFEIRKSIYDGCVIANSVLFHNLINQITCPIFICVIDPVFFIDKVVSDIFFSRLKELLGRGNVTLVTYYQFHRILNLRLETSDARSVRYIFHIPRHGYRVNLDRDAQRLVVNTYNNVMPDCVISIAAVLAKKICFFGCDGVSTESKTGSNVFSKESGLGDIELQLLEGFKRLNPKNFTGPEDEQYLQRLQLGISAGLTRCQRSGVEVKVIKPSKHSAFRYLEVGE